MTFSKADIEITIASEGSLDSLNLSEMDLSGMKFNSINFNEIDIIHDGWLNLGVYDFTWDSASFSDGYYRIIINMDNEEICYRNIRILGD